MLYLGEGLEWLVIVAFNGREMRWGVWNETLVCVGRERERDLRRRKTKELSSTQRRGFRRGKELLLSCQPLLLYVYEYLTHLYHCVEIRELEPAKAQIVSGS